MKKEELKSRTDAMLDLVRASKHDEAVSEAEKFLDALKDDTKELEALLEAHQQAKTDAERIIRFVDEKSQRQVAGTGGKNSVVDSLRAIDPSIKVDGPLTRVSDWARKASGNLRKPQVTNAKAG